MADIRKRTGKKGISYQVRYASAGTKSGYAYASFDTLKEARAYHESGATAKRGRLHSNEIRTVAEATDMWLRICEKEGIDGREPVTRYTLKNYQYRAEFIKRYPWPKDVAEISTPDIVAFRSWLLGGEASRAVSSKVLSSLHSVLKEMKVRDIVETNPVVGITVRAESRYQEPVKIPTKQEIAALLSAADRLASSTNKLTARTWQRYRPMLYLAVDSGMRPQEYIALSRSALREDGVYIDRAIEGGGTEISVTKTPAGRRFIDLSPETLVLVRHYADHHAVKNEYDLVFPAENGRWQCRRNWQRRGFEVACLEAGLVETVEIDGKEVEQAKYRPYDLRHFFASMLIESKVNLKKIQSLMGHTNIETTLNVYGHLIEDSTREKISTVSLLSGIRGISCGEFVAEGA